MKVKAVKVGYYLHRRRRVGEIFDLVAKTAMKDGKMVVVATPEKQFSNLWMAKVETSTTHGKKVQEENKSNDSPGTGNQEVI